MGSLVPSPGSRFSTSLNETKCFRKCFSSSLITHQLMRRTNAALYNPLYDSHSKLVRTFCTTVLWAPEGLAKRFEYTKLKPFIRAGEKFPDPWFARGPFHGQVFGNYLFRKIKFSCGTQFYDLFLSHMTFYTLRGSDPVLLSFFFSS